MPKLKRKKAYSLYYVLLVVAFIMICVTIISSSFLNIAYANKLSQAKKEISVMQYQIGEVFPEAIRKGYKPNQNGSSVSVSSLDGYSFQLRTVNSIGKLRIKDETQDLIYWEEDYTITTTPNPADTKVVVYSFSSSSGLGWNFVYSVVYTSGDLSAVNSITRTRSVVNLK